MNRDHGVISTTSFLPRTTCWPPCAAITLPWIVLRSR